MLIMKIISIKSGKDFIFCVVNWRIKTRTLNMHLVEDGIVQLHVYVGLEGTVWVDQHECVVFHVQKHLRLEEASPKAPDHPVDTQFAEQSDHRFG